MAMINERRDARLEVRVPPSLRDRVSRAATLSGQTVAAFVTSVVQEAAQRVIDGADQTQLTVVEFDRLLHALDAEPTPNASLREAAARYRLLGTSEA